LSYNQGYPDLSLGPRIPNGWRIEKLGNVASYVQEKVDNTQIDKTRYISTENLIPNRGGILVSSKKPNESKINTYMKGDILFSNIRPYFKKIWMAKFSGGCSNDVLVIRPNSNVNADFIYYYLSQEDFFDYATLTSKGTKMPRGDKEAIMNFLVNVPPIFEQHAIAKILSDLDEKIELNNQMNKTLEDIVQAIFKRWFIDFEFPNENGDPYKSSGGEMVESELGMMPKGWCLKRLGEIIINHDSKRIPLSRRERGERHGIYPYYGATGVIDYIDDYIFNGIYLLLAEDGSVVNSDDTPVLQYVDGKFWCNNHAHVLTGRENFSTEFVYCLLRTTSVKGLVTGAVQLKINQLNLNELKVIAPPKELLEDFQNIVRNLFATLRLKRIENSALGKIRDLLLPKLMTGRIRVPMED